MDDEMDEEDRDAILRVMEALANGRTSLEEQLAASEAARAALVEAGNKMAEEAERWQRCACSGDEHTHFSHLDDAYEAAQAWRALLARADGEQA